MFKDQVLRVENQLRCWPTLVVVMGGEVMFCCWEEEEEEEEADLPVIPPELRGARALLPLRASPDFVRAMDWDFVRVMDWEGRVGFKRG